MLAETQSCCSTPVSPKIQYAIKDLGDEIMDMLEKAAAVALTVFSLLMNTTLFIPFFLVGVAVGVYLYVKETNSGNRFSPTSCSQGLMERLLGVKLPPPLSLAADVAVTVCHIEHHGSVFAPIIGLLAGAWAGKNGSEGCVYLYRKFRHIDTIELPKLLSPSCCQSGALCRT